MVLHDLNQAGFAITLSLKDGKIIKCGTSEGYYRKVLQKCLIFKH